MIKTKDLHIGYHRPLLAVENLDLEAAVYILVGRNGSGKSTFLKTISGQIQPISGSVELDGSDINQLAVNEIPKKIAFVQSHFPTVDFLRVSEYIALGRSPHSNYFGKLSSADEEAVNEAIELLGLADFKNRFTDRLSDGERQLVSIARAFAQGTEVIALDEPTAFLDYKNKALILEKLIELAKKHGKCIVLSSHDIDQSLNSSCPFLIVNEKTKTVELHSESIDKPALLKKAFG